MKENDQIAELHETVLWYLSEAELARLDGTVERLRKAETSFRDKAIKLFGSSKSTEAQNLLQEIVTFCKPISLSEANSKERVQWLERLRKKVLALTEI